MEAKVYEGLAGFDVPILLCHISTTTCGLEFAELQEMGVKAEVKNLLGETSVMDTLTADFAQLRTSKSATLQMKKLPSANGDSLLCVVKTFAGVEKESELLSL